MAEASRRAAKLKACGFHHRLDELQGDKISRNRGVQPGGWQLGTSSFARPRRRLQSGDLLKKTADAVDEAAESSSRTKMRVRY